MATFSDNTTIKIDTAVAASIGFSAFSGRQTVYTCPANCYSILQYSLDFVSFGATVSVFVGNVPIKRINVNSPQNAQQMFPIVNTDPSNITNYAENIYVGPGQSVQVEAAGSGSGVFRVQGVQFKNSPV